MVSASIQSQDEALVDELDAPSEQVTTGEVDPSQVAAPETDASEDAEALELPTE